MLEGTAIRDIERRLAYFESLTSWSPVPPGSILRVPVYAYPKWGIILSEESMGWAASASERAYAVEWACTGESSNRLISDAAGAAGLGDVNAGLNSAVATAAAAHLEGAIRSSGSFRCMDVGAGTGATTIALLNELAGLRIAPRAEGRITLIEPSETRAEAAKAAVGAALSRHGWATRIGFEIICRSDIGALVGMPAETEDLVISNAAIHHHSFNLHLRRIRNALRPGMPFINGDWHDSMSETPARAYWLLCLLQNPHDAGAAARVLAFLAGDAAGAVVSERPELAEFRRYFSISEAAACSAFSGLGRHHLLANAGIARFWLEVGKRFSRPERAPLLFLEAHERVGRRRQNLLSAGFMFDEECRRKYRSLLEGNGELASVIMAKRPPRRGSRT